MSEWTYVRGALEFSCSPFELKKGFKERDIKREDFKTEEEYDAAVEEQNVAYHKAVYLPYPEEQFKLGAPIVTEVPDRTQPKVKGHDGRMLYPDKSVIGFNGTVIYSLPRAKPILEKAFRLFPQGELGFRYTLEQREVDANSSVGGFIHPCLYKYYHDAITKAYSNFSSPYGEKWTYEELVRYIGVEEDCQYECASNIICGVFASLRDATAEMVYESLISFLKFLEEREIDVYGYLEWYDSHSAWAGYRYAYRSGSWTGEYTIMKLDFKTNKIIWKLEHKHPKKSDRDMIDFDTFVDVETTVEQEEK